MSFPVRPCVSVLMPCRNAWPYLQEAVASVLQQPECLELLVADGGSTDGSLEMLESWAHNNSRIRIVSRSDSGPADALNQAFKSARGTLIGWLNADDLYPLGALARAVAALDVHPEWLMLYGEGVEFNSATGLQQRYPTFRLQWVLRAFVLTVSFASRLFCSAAIWGSCSGRLMSSGKHPSISIIG